MKARSTYLCIGLLMALSACAAPRGAHEHFDKPKYKIRERARDGRPNVSQRWFSRWWFWQNPGREPHNPAAPKFQPE